MFEILDCRVVASINGLAGYQELLNTNETNKFDCIISDYEMPEMDGLELIKIIKQYYTFSFILEIIRLRMYQQL